jgi:hypothetical protein
MKAREQLFQAGLLGAAAFHAGKPQSPAGDGDFLEFLLSCGDRQVGCTPAGEAPTLALLDAWIRHWHQASESRARPSRVELSKHTAQRNAQCEPRNDAQPGSLTRPSQVASSRQSD